MTYLDRLHAFIAEHGFQSWDDPQGRICIAIPATRREADGSVTVTTFVERCKPSLFYVKRALGY